MPRFTWMFSCRAATPRYVLASEVPMGKHLTSQFAWFSSRNSFQEYLKAANSPRRETSIMSLPCCPPLTPPAASSSASLCCNRLWRRRAAALCGRRYGTCFVCFPHLASGLMGNCSLQKKRRKSIPICVTAAQLWQSKSGRSSAETSGRCAKQATLQSVLTPLIKHDVQLQQKCPLSSCVPQIINLNLSKQSLSSWLASPSCLCCSARCSSRFLGNRRWKSTITSWRRL